MVTELIGKYIWLLQRIVDASPRGLTYPEIARAYENRYNQPYPRRSFCNHREAVAEVFGIEIECRRSDNRYFVAAGEDALSADASAEWLINTFTVSSLLALGKERLSGRVAVDEVPSGYRFLTRIMQAMQESRVLRIRYRKYDGSEPDERTVHPYAVKEFARRWYLTGWTEERGAERLYGLDRILSLEILPETFRLPEGYEVEERFAESFGPYLPEEGAPVWIRFRATAREARFLADLPLHPSQTVESEEPDGSVILSVRVIPNDSLIMEFCRHGNRIEVLSPASVREAVRVALADSLQIYQR